MIKELQYDASARGVTKILPQRAFNAYVKGYSAEVVYHPGDFILHFAGIRERSQLKELMENYAQKAVAP